MAPNPPSLRYRLEYAGYRLLALIFGLLPVELAAKLSGAAFAFLGPKARKPHPRLLSNLAAAYPEKSEAEREALAVEVWRNLGYVLGEFFHIDDIVRDRVEMENPEIFEELAASDKGAVICGAHQANWEVGSAVISTYGMKPIGVYRPMSNPFVDADVLRRRKKYFPGGLMGKHDPATPMAFIRFARAGGVVCALVDQQTYMGLPTPFFGRPAASTPFPALVARQCNIPLVLLHGHRLPGSRFKLSAVKIDVPRSDDRDKDIFTATAAIQAELEKSIRQHPEQWMWTHNRWL
jgi:Kdo2-lipid IVA lauroyltransferase/acyltransferase